MEGFFGFSVESIATAIFIVAIFALQGWSLVLAAAIWGGLAGGPWLIGRIIGLPIFILEGFEAGFDKY